MYIVMNIWVSPTTLLILRISISFSTLKWRYFTSKWNSAIYKPYTEIIISSILKLFSLLSFLPRLHLPAVWNQLRDHCLPVHHVPLRSDPLRPHPGGLEVPDWVLDGMCPDNVGGQQQQVSCIQRVVCVVSVLLCLFCYKVIR